MIQLYDRKTKSYDTEQVPGEKWLSWLYETSSGHWFLEGCIKRRWYSFLTGLYCDSALSRRMIPSFIQKYHISIEEALEAPEAYASFNAFFTRRLRADARPFSSDPQLLVSPGDGRVQVFPQIHKDRVWQIKGSSYRLIDLLQDAALADRFEGGSCILLRLAPVDYHRFHFMEAGVAEAPQKFPGKYYSVNPIALHQVREVFCRNVRMTTLLHTQQHGDLLYVEVGATSVGSIVQLLPHGGEVVRGQEKGFFKFGGSTVLIFMEPQRAVFDADLLEMSARGIETRVFAGESLGRWREKEDFLKIL